jgi:predicted nucleotidyltransferase component of viral defense system
MSADQLKLYEKLSKEDFINDFYLAGGTALALQIGHRRSLDFDFFTPSDFDTAVITGKLNGIGEYRRENEERNTINGSLDGVKISFFGYKYSVIDQFRVLKGIRIAGLKDIAAMKLEAVAARGSRKDFVDMFFLLKLFSLKEIFSFHESKYGPGLNNRYHLLKSLVWFEDAEEEALPVMTGQVKWADIKKSIVKTVKQYGIRL